MPAGRYWVKVQGVNVPNTNALATDSAYITLEEQQQVDKPQITSTAATPKEGLAGSQFTFTVKVSNKPDQVYIQFDDGQGSWLSKDTCKSIFAMQLQGSSSSNDATYVLAKTINTPGQPGIYQRKIRVWAENIAGEAYKEDYIVVKASNPSGPQVTSITVNNGKPIVLGQDNNLVPIEFTGKAGASIKQIQFYVVKNGTDYLKETISPPTEKFRPWDTSYTTPGTYQVKIVITDLNDVKGELSKTVEVKQAEVIVDKPQITSTAATPKEGLAGSQFTFTVKVSNKPDQVYIQFDDGEGGWLSKDTCKNGFVMQLKGASNSKETTYVLAPTINTPGQPSTFQRKYRVWAENIAGEAYKEDYIVVKTTSNAPVIKYDSTGDDVAVLQAYLWNGNAQDTYGKYGYDTEMAVGVWQEQYNKSHPNDQIKTDGKVGRQTWGAMGFLNARSDLDRTANPYLKYLELAKSKGYGRVSPDLKAELINRNTIRLTWKVVLGVDSYNVYVSDAQKEVGPLDHNLWKSGIVGNSINITKQDGFKIIADNEYYFVVTSVTRGQESGYSTQVSLNTPKPLLVTEQDVVDVTDKLAKQYFLDGNYNLDEDIQSDELSKVMFNLTLWKKISNEGKNHLFGLIKLVVNKKSPERSINAIIGYTSSQIRDDFILIGEGRCIDEIEPSISTAIEEWEKCHVLATKNNGIKDYETALLFCESFDKALAHDMAVHDLFVDYFEKQESPEEIWANYIREWNETFLDCLGAEINHTFNKLWDAKDAASKIKDVSKIANGIYNYNSSQQWIKDFRTDLNDRLADASQFLDCAKTCRGKK